MLERNLGRDARSLPSSCEYFPIESCSSLKACTSRLVLAANKVRSHFEGKVFTFVLRRYFLHISPPFQRMSTDVTTSKAVLKAKFLSTEQFTVIQASSGLKDTQVNSPGNSTKKLYKFKF